MDTRDVIAIIAVITGLVGATSALFSSMVTYFSFRRDGFLVKITGKRGWKLINAIPPYSDKKSYSVITVYNQGRRKATISKVGETNLFYFGGSIYADSMQFGAQQVGEDDAHDYLGEEDVKNKRPTTGYYYAVTKGGKMFKYYPHSRIIYWSMYPVRKFNQIHFKFKKKTK